MSEPMKNHAVSNELSDVDRKEHPRMVVNIVVHLDMIMNPVEYQYELYNI